MGKRSSKKKKEGWGFLMGKVEKPEGGTFRRLKISREGCEKKKKKGTKQKKWRGKKQRIEGI